MKNIILVVMFYLLISACDENPTKNNNQDNTDIYQWLLGQNELTVNEINPINGFDRQFEVYITQPLDHDNPNLGTFQQRIFLSHKGYSNPMVFMPSGYSSSPTKVCELSETLNANQIYAAQRFMIGAEPVTMNWEYLNSYQIACDFHRIVELFNTIYTSSWISYGASKNGQSALIHKRFYPNDVKATIAISASLAFHQEDPRYEEFINSVGTKADRYKIKQYQRSVLLNREEIVELLDNYINQSEYTFSRLTSDEIIEYEVLEFPYAFWQTTDGKTNSIPDSQATAQELFDYIKDFGYLDYYSNQLLDFSKPVYYQAYTELGWYRLIDDYLKDLIKYLDNPSYRNFCPKNVTINFNSNVMLDINSWLQSSGDNIIYIYGENDPWAACAIENTGITNSLLIKEPNSNHNIKVNSLTDRNLVIDSITKWIK